jgi:hypothetical protein
VWLQVYTPAQAARAAKAGVAKLQQIEDRRSFGLAAANPLALALVLPHTNASLLTDARRQ